MKLSKYINKIMNRKLRKRCRKMSKNKLAMENYFLQQNHLQIPAVEASSPKKNNVLVQQDEEVIRKAKINLEGIKKEISRQARLTKFKLGTECIKLPFKKCFFAKNVNEFYQKGISGKSSNIISGLSTLSFTNAVSSTGNSSKIQDKNGSYEFRNKKPDNSRGLKSKEVTIRETTIEIPKSKFLRRNNSDETSERESSTNVLFKLPMSKKLGGRAVAMVTPGPEVNKPLSVLRRPTAGELAVSLFGSPLLVAPDCAPTTMPQINLPTADGKVVAILPREGFTVDDMPLIATPTRHQLRTLNKYLNDLCLQHERI